MVIRGQSRACRNRSSRAYPAEESLDKKSISSCFHHARLRYLAGDTQIGLTGFHQKPLRHG